MNCCHCSLAGTIACLNCFNNPNIYWGNNYPFRTLEFWNPGKKIIKITKEYDKDGNLIKEIIEE